MPALKYRYFLLVALAGCASPEPEESTVTAALFGQPTTIGVYRFTESRWLLRSSNTPGSPNFDYVFPGTGATNVPVAGDWNGNIVSTAGVFRPANSPQNPGSAARWLLRNTNNSGPPNIDITFGGPGDLPVVGDWDGNGTVTIGVYRPAQSASNPSIAGFFLLRNSNTSGNPDITSIPFGGAGDVPVVGDWDGNGTTTIGVFRPSTNTWFLHNSFTFAGPPDPPSFQYGFTEFGDLPVVGDWDGNGTATIGVYRPSTGPGVDAFWMLRNSNTPGIPSLNFPYGGFLDRPVVGNWSIFVR
jgi:hypothetical protein